MRPSVGTHNHLAFFWKILKSVTIVRVEPQLYNLKFGGDMSWWLACHPPMFSKRNKLISFDNILLDIYLQYTFYSLRAMPVGTTAIAI